MKILMTADTVGGVWTYACELIRGLASFGVDVTLATMGAPPSPAQARTVANLSNADLVTSRFALEWMPDPWRDVDASSDWLLELARTGRYDVVHVNGYAHAALPFGIPTISVAHSCVCTWFQAVYGCAAPPEWDEYRRRVRAGLVGATAVVAPTRAILNAVLAAYDVQIAGRVIPNGRDTAQWKPDKKELFVLAAGRLWDEAKGLDALEECATRVRWPIHVAGPTMGPGGVGAIQTRSVKLLGELRPEALASWMGRASIYALPARYEPFGLSVLEAALSGCALVLGDIPTLREVWGDAALYVKPGHPDVLALALDALAADPLRRRAMSAAARARAQHLTPLRMANAYNELYCQVAGARDEEVCA